MKILILKPGTLREFICATPAIKAVREHYPDAKITLLTTSVGREICPEGSLVDSHIEFERYHSNAGLLRLVSVIRRQKFSLVINLCEQSKRLAFLTTLSGASVTAGVNSNFFGKFYTNPTPPLLTNSHAHPPYDGSMELIQKIGITSSDITPVVYRSDRQKRMARDYFDKHGLYKKSTLVLAPTSHSPLRAWPPENFAVIGRKFLTKYGGKVLITWSGSTLGTAQEVQKLIGERAIICPKTSLGEFAAILAEAGVFVCHDSSAMHIAYSVQVPTVYLHAPIEQTKDTKLQIGIPSMRLHYQTQDRELNVRDEDIAAQLSTIRNERVWEAVEKLWNVNYY